MYDVFLPQLKIISTNETNQCVILFYIDQMNASIDPLEEPANSLIITAQKHFDYLSHNVLCMYNQIHLN